MKYHLIIIKTKENHRISCENYESHENIRTLFENHGNYENHMISWEHHENCENLENPFDNYENHEA